MDINGDGVLSWQEFVPCMRYLLISYIPRIILGNMGLTKKKIFLFVAIVGINLFCVYLFISLVFVAFTTGQGLSLAMHSTMAAGTGAYQHVKSGAGESTGGGGGVTAFLEGIASKVKESIILTLGLSKTVSDRLLKMVESVV